MFGVSRRTWKVFEDDELPVALTFLGFLLLIPVIAAARFTVLLFRLIATEGSTKMKLTTIAIVLLSILALAGCGSFKGTVSEWLGEDDRGLRLAAEESMDRIIDGSEAEQVKVIRTIESIRSYVDGAPEVQANMVVDRIAKQVPWDKLDDKEAGLVESLLALLRDEIQEKHEEGVIDKKDRIQIKRYLDIIEDAAYSVDVDKVALA